MFPSKEGTRAICPLLLTGEKANFTNGEGDLPIAEIASTSPASGDGVGVSPAAYLTLISDAASLLFLPEILFRSVIGRPI